jgi:DNA-binding transcriptional LysR family regulator
MEKMFPWEDYEIFTHVVRHGSFTAAAEYLAVSKSVVSRHVASLEARLGTQLLLRTTRSVSPTEAGRELYLSCTSALEILSDIEKRALEGQGVPRGLLKIAALDYFGETYVAPVAANMMEEFEGLEIELHISSEPRDIVTEAFDVSLLYDQQKSSTYLTRKVYDLDHCIAASPQYLKDRGVPIHPDDLVNHSCLVSTFSACAPWSFVIDGRRVDYELDGRWRSNSGPALISAACTGIGLARLPRLYLKPYLDSRRLVTVLESYLAPPMPVWAVYAHNRQPSVTLQTFLERLIHKMRSVEKSVELG